jgi:hypothetical protein
LIGLKLLEKKEFAASPLYGPALQLRASARLQSGKPAEAQADVEQLLKKEPAADQKNKLATLRLIRALALTAQQGKEAEAEAALTELIQAGPADAPTDCISGTIRITTGTMKTVINSRRRVNALRSFLINAASTVEKPRRPKKPVLGA